MRYPALLPSINDRHSREQLERIFAGAAVAASNHRQAANWDGAVVSLHEREGLLFVCWRSLDDSVHFREAIRRGWHGVGEYAPILHWFKGGPRPDAVW